MSEPASNVTASSPRPQRVLWHGAVIGFTLICLWPIWSSRLPALQDYPLHLLQAQLLAHRSDPHCDFIRYVDFHLQLGYAAFHVITASLCKLLPTEAAGKAALSLYIVLVASVVEALGRRTANEEPRWGALLLFPLALHQQYFQGNINYCYSLPLVILALHDQRRLSEEPVRVAFVVRHLVVLTAIVVTHLFSGLVCLLLTALQAGCDWRKPNRLRRAAISPLACGILLAACLIFNRLAGSAPLINPGANPVWNPLSESLGYYLCMFTGLQWHNGISFTTVLPWLGIGACVIMAVRNRFAGVSPCLWLLLSVPVVGLIVAPFRWGDYTYLNLRLAPLSYCLVVLLLAQLRFHRWQSAVLVALTAVLLLQAVAKQRRISHELAEIIPIIQQIPPHAKILPLLFDRDSPELDSVYFDPHLHAPNYYHVFTNSGISPYFLRASVHPVHFKPGTTFPAPDHYTPQEFLWDQHADDYRYFLVRGAPLPFLVYVNDKTDPIAKSGNWILLKRRNHVPT
jgi:hypothetical protein